MDTERILNELRSERERIDRAISVLESSDGAGRRRGRPPGGRRRHMSADARRRISEMMKKRWAERKKKAKS